MGNFSTERLPPRERAARYERVLSDYCSSLDSDVNAEVRVDEPDVFVATMDVFSLGRLTGAVHRTNSMNRRYASRGAYRGGLIFYHVLKGDLVQQSDDGVVTLLPGDMAFFRPCPIAEFRSPSGSIEMFGFHLPQSVIQSRAPSGDIRPGLIIPESSALGACVPALLRTAEQRHRDMSRAELSVLQTALADTVVQLGRTASGAAKDGLDEEQGDKLRHMQAIALGALDDPDLDPWTLAQEAGVSIRTLHRLFHASGITFRAWVRDQRLERCWDELSDPLHRGETVASIALKWGFRDLTTFNRCFRERYGVSPLKTRAASRQA